MTKKCSNCSAEQDSQVTVCQNCGYLFNEKSIETDFKKEQQTDHSNNRKIDETIDWSELKNVSLGHVMEMFNEQQEKEKNDLNYQQPDEQNEQQTDNTPTGDATNPSNLTIHSETSNQVVHKPEKEPEITTDSFSEDQVILENYIKEHKEQTLSLKEQENKILNNEIVDIADSDQTEVELEQNHSNNIANVSEVKQGMDKELSEGQVPAIPMKEKKDEQLANIEKTVVDHQQEYTTKKENLSNAQPSNNNHQQKKQASNAQPSKRANNRSMDQKRRTKRAGVTISLTAVVVLAVGGIVLYHANQPSSQEENAQHHKTEKVQTSLIKQTNQLIDAYYTDTTHQFLKPDQVAVNTQKIQQNIEKLKSNHSSYKNLNRRLQELKDKQSIVTQVNQWFTQPIIKGNQLAVATMAADKPMTIKKLDQKDAFSQLANQAIDQANEQYSQLQKAKELTKLLFDNQQVLKTVTNESYKNAQAEVNKIKNEKLREPLNQQLAKVNQMLIEKEAAKKAETSNTQEKSAVEKNSINNNTMHHTQTNKQGYSSPNNKGIYTEPLYPTNQADIADTNNPAWTWNPGVKEKVIATCIKRGYIVEGGYTLEPVKIVNGEGYYNLYATNNHSRLLRGTTEKKLPTYLVTINAKTGWFKGNGSRNANR